MSSDTAIGLVAVLGSVQRALLVVAGAAVVIGVVGPRAVAAR